MSRGLTNNNPGNIKKSGTIYQGEVIPSLDPVFKQFQTLAYGYRAMFMLLHYYIRKGFNTIEKIITRYAPPEENATAAYISFVENKTGIGRQVVLTRQDAESIMKIGAAISWMENGEPANDQALKEGYTMTGFWQTVAKKLPGISAGLVILAVIFFSFIQQRK